MITILLSFVDTELEGMINNVADLVSGVGEITIGFAVGDIAGVLTGILSIINTIFNLFVIHKSDVPELRVELAEITLELQKQQAILSQVIGTAKVEAIQDQIDLLNEQIDVYNDMIAAEEAAYGQFLFITWDETDQQKIEEWLSSIESANAEIANLAATWVMVSSPSPPSTKVISFPIILLPIKYPDCIFKHLPLPLDIHFPLVFLHLIYRLYLSGIYCIQYYRQSSR